MIESFLSVGTQVLILFLMIGTGFVLGKLHLITHKGAVSMSNLLMYVVSPCILIVVFQRPLETETFHNFWVALLAALVIHGINILVSELVIRDRDPMRKSFFRFSAIFSNCGFMAVPLQTAILGSLGVFYGSAYLLVFTVLTWTLGIQLVKGGKMAFSWRTLLMNPGVIGVAIAMVLYLLQITLPEIILSPHYISLRHEYAPAHGGHRLPAVSGRFPPGAARGQLLGVGGTAAADFAAAGTGGVYADAAGLRRDAGGGHCGQHTSGGAAGDVRRQVRQGCVSGTVAGGGADAAVHDHYAAGAGTGEVPGLSFFCIIEIKSGNQPFPDFIFTLGGDHGKTVSHRISTPQTSAIYSGRHPFRLHSSGQPSSCSAAVDTSQPKDSSV